MAITVTTFADKLNTINPAYSPIIFEFTSDTATIQSCIVEIAIGTTNSNVARVSAVSVSPNLGTTNAFKIDVSATVQDYLDMDLNTLNSNGFQFSNNAKKTLQLKIYEVTESGGVTSTAYNPDDANNTSFDAKVPTGATILVVNYNLDIFEKESYDATEYEFYNFRNGTKFLTKSPLTKDIELNQNEFLGLGWYDSLDQKDYSAEILTYNSSNALLNTDTISLSEWSAGWVTLSGAIEYIWCDLAVGTKNLIEAGISLTNVAYYTVKIVNPSGDRSELRRYNIVASCGTDYRIHWFNNFSKQESITFKGNNVEEISFKTNTFQKVLPSVSLGSFDTSKRGVTTMQTNRETIYTVYTKSIGRLVYDFACSILDNNNAYVEIGGKYYPIVILDTSVIKRDEEDMPIQFKLEYKLSNSYKGIRG